VSTDTLTRWRPHRGGLAEAMEELACFGDVEALRQHLAERYGVPLENVTGIATCLYDDMPDSRIGWPATWAVLYTIKYPLAAEPMRMISFADRKLPGAAQEVRL
jgi:hypothetical protein